MCVMHVCMLFGFCKAARIPEEPKQTQGEHASYIEKPPSGLLGKVYEKFFTPIQARFFTVPLKIHFLFIFLQLFVFLLSILQTWQQFMISKQSNKRILTIFKKKIQIILYSYFATNIFKE